MEVEGGVDANAGHGGSCVEVEALGVVRDGVSEGVDKGEPKGARAELHEVADEAVTRIRHKRSCSRVKEHRAEVGDGGGRRRIHKHEAEGIAVWRVSDYAHEQVSCGEHCGPKRENSIASGEDHGCSDCSRGAESRHLDDMRLLCGRAVQN